MCPGSMLLMYWEICVAQVVTWNWRDRCSESSLQSSHAKMAEEILHGE